VTNLLFKCSPSVSVSSIYTSVGVWTVSSVSSVGSVGGVSVWAGVSVSSIPGFWFGFSFSLAKEVSSSIGGDWGGISGMGVDRWVSIGTIGGSVWVSSISVVSIGQPWLGIRFSFSFSLADVVNSSIGGDWGGISGMGVDSGWVSISTIGGSVWVSSISVVSIGQPWLGIRFGFSGSLSDEVSSISGVSGVSKSVGGVWVGTIGGVSSGVWVSSISQVRVSQPWLGISLGFRFWLSKYAGYEDGGNKEEFHFVLDVDTIEL